MRLPQKLWPVFILDFRVGEMYLEWLPVEQSNWLARVALQVLLQPPTFLPCENT